MAGGGGKLGNEKFLTGSALSPVPFWAAPSSGAAAVSFSKVVLALALALALLALAVLALASPALAPGARESNATKAKERWRIAIRALDRADTIHY